MAGVSTLSSPAYRPKPATVSRSVLRRRWNRQRRRSQQFQEQLRQTKRHCAQLQQQLRQLRTQLDDAHGQLRSRQREAEQAGARGCLLDSTPMPGHQFGPGFIALCIELAKRIGFRATAFVIARVFEAFGVAHKVPSHDVIEQWTLRLGVGELQDTFTKGQDVLWMADHSSQIGKEKVLLIIGVALEDLPPPGKTLDLEAMKVLAIVPGQHWKREDVQREYQRLAERIGPPVYLLCDGAVELREPAEMLEKDGQKPIVLGDLKHHAANLLEKQIGRHERFKEFLSQVGLTRNRVQQTELGHFAPPPVKQKSRFMNLGPLLGWAAMVLHHLDSSTSDSRVGITQQRMEAKLGWLRSFVSDLPRWQECQEVIDQSLSVVNCHGLSKESAAMLKDVLDPWLRTPDDAERPACCLARELTEFVQGSQAKLRDQERAWLSTELLESLFGKFKQLECQHSRGGFTRLLAALPTLCRRADTSLIRRRFARVKAKDVTNWISTTLGRTLTARRNRAYRDYRLATRAQV